MPPGFATLPWNHPNDIRVRIEHLRKLERFWERPFPKVPVPQHLNALLLDVLNAPKSKQLLNG